MAICNSTLDHQRIVEDPLWNHGLTFHQVGLIVCAAFGLFAICVSFFLIFQHGIHYSKPYEQRQIIRIIFMIPIYSAVSFLSYLYYTHSIYYQVLRDCYEAFAISSFFVLLCNYIAPNLHDQKEYFRTIEPKNWFWSVFGLQKLTGGQDKGPLRRPRSGLTWFNVVYLAIFQYCFIRVFFTIISVITQATDRYCAESDSPAFAHIWVQAFEALSVTIAMFCLVQFYLQLKDDLAPHRPFLKVLSIKLVIFFTFWQTWIINILSSSRGPLNPTNTLAYADIKVGIPTLLLCIEMAIFSVMHLFAFPWKGYKISDDPHVGTEAGEAQHYQGGKLGLKAYIDAFNPWDIIKATARGFRWLFIGRRHRFEDSSYKGIMNPAGNKLGSIDGSISNERVGSSGRKGSKQPPTEMVPGANRKTDTDGTEDTAGLLANAHNTYPSRHDVSPVRGDIGMQHSRMNTSDQMPMPSAYGGYDDVGMHPGYGSPSPDTGYHAPSAAPSAGAPIGAAYGGQEEWNHWAGASRDDYSGGQSRR
ncbi:hypothetical protein MBLNU457_g2539t1 [Dothideomycetes sp. NU457]